MHYAVVAKEYENNNKKEIPKSGKLLVVINKRN
jgi:hypothetical protein